MGWWDAGNGALAGDQPLDEYGDAMKEIAARFRKHAKRLPMLGEVVAAFDATAPPGPSPSFDALARAAEGEAPLVSTRPPPLRTGELVAIPYAEGRAVVGLVLFGSERKEKGPRFGACVVALDLEPGELGTDLDRARTARWLTQPFHPGLLVSWARLGQVVLEPRASFLPCFGRWERPDLAADLERHVSDYFGADVTGQPDAEPRVIEPVIGGVAGVVVSIRAARGLNRELPWARHALHPDAPHTPLAALPPFVAARAPAKRKKTAAPMPADDALLGFLAERLRETQRVCTAAWREAADRDPTREELAHALLTVVSVLASDFLADPTRAESLPRRAPPPSTTSAGQTECTFAERHGVDTVSVGTGARKWPAFPFREGGELILEVFLAPPNVLELVPAILRAWREARGLPAGPEPVVVRRMEWGEPLRTEG